MSAPERPRPWSRLLGHDPARDAAVEPTHPVARLLWHLDRRVHGAGSGSRRLERWRALWARDPEGAIGAFYTDRPDGLWVPNALLRPADLTAMARWAAALPPPPPSADPARLMRHPPYRVAAVLAGVARQHPDAQARFTAWSGLLVLQPPLAWSLLRPAAATATLEPGTDPWTRRQGPRLHPGSLPLLLPDRCSAAPLLAHPDRRVRELAARLLADAPA